MTCPRRAERTATRGSLVDVAAWFLRLLSLTRAWACSGRTRQARQPAWQRRSTRLPSATPGTALSKAPAQAGLRTCERNPWSQPDTFPPMQWFSVGFSRLPLRGQCRLGACMPAPTSRFTLPPLARQQDTCGPPSVTCLAPSTSTHRPEHPRRAWALKPMRLPPPLSSMAVLTTSIGQHRWRSATRPRSKKAITVRSGRWRRPGRSRQRQDFAPSVSSRSHLCISRAGSAAPANRRL